MLLGVFDSVRNLLFFLTHPFSLALGVFVGAGAIAAPIQIQPQPKTTGGLKVQQTVKVKKDHLKVQLKSCVKAKPNVVCTLFLSSSKDDVIVWVSDPNRGKSRLVDLDGNEYTTFEVNQFGRPETGTLLVSKAPVKLILSFTKLPQNLSSVALMEIGLETYGREIPVRFRKVNFLATTPGVPVLPPKPVEKIPPRDTPQTPTEEPAGTEQPPTGTEQPPAEEPAGTEQPPAEEPGTEQPPAEEPAGTEQPPAEEPAGTEQPPAEEPAGTEQPPAETEQSPAEEPAGTEQPPAETEQPPAESEKVPETPQGEPQQDTTDTEPERQPDSTQPDANDSGDETSPEQPQTPETPPTSSTKSPSTGK